jgi:hypothetical protein
MNMQQGEVQRTIRDLEIKTLVQVDENFKSRVEKYRQRFCNTRYSDYQFDPPQIAIVCLLLLRGPQTPGELRVRSGRLHSFVDNATVVDTLSTLLEWEGNPLVVRLPRTPGRKDSEYMHLFSGPIDMESHPGPRQTPIGEKHADRDSLSGLERRVNQLEAEIAELRHQLKSSQ